jgi:hypothetical protein
MEELSQLSAKFAENLLDATNAFSEVVTDESLLAGLPADAKEAAKTAAEKAGVDGWRFSLQAPSYGPVMQYADNRELRARLYRAYATRAAEFTDGTSKPEWDNTPIIQRMLELRVEDAKMLGFNNFAEVSLAPKMADTPAQVLAFLRELAAKAKPFAEKDIAELRAFAKDELGLADFQPWDAAYVSEKLLQARYAFSEQEVKQYFTEPKVLGGLFKVIESLFNVKVKPDTAPGGTRTSASTVWKRRPASWSASSTSTSTPAKPNAAAPGWTKPARAAGCSTASRSRSPTSTATSRARSAASRRPSRTTTSPRCSTKPATACTICSRGAKSSAFRASTASNGMPSNCRRSSWKTIAGNGKWSRG